MSTINEGKIYHDRRKIKAWYFWQTKQLNLHGWIHGWIVEFSNSRKHKDIPEVKLGLKDIDTYVSFYLLNKRASHDLCCSIRLHQSAELVYRIRVLVIFLYYGAISSRFYSTPMEPSAQLYSVHAYVMLCWYAEHINTSHILKCFARFWGVGGIKKRANLQFYFYLKIGKTSVGGFVNQENKKRSPKGTIHKAQYLTRW